MKQAEQRQTGACRDKPEPVKAKQTPQGQTGTARVFHQLLVKARVTCRSSWHLRHGTARVFAPGHGEAEGEDLGRSWGCQGHRFCPMSVTLGRRSATVQTEAGLWPSEHSGHCVTSDSQISSKFLLCEKNVSWTYCGNHFTTYVNQTITLYALSLYSDVCQLFLNKTGENKIKIKMWKTNSLTVKKKKNFSGHQP